MNKLNCNIYNNLTNMDKNNRNYVYFPIKIRTKIRIKSKKNLFGEIANLIYSEIIWLR